MTRQVSLSEISQHKKPDDIWIIVDNNVYDITSFAPTHPGGPEIIHRYAGADATEEYNRAHFPSLIKKTLTGDHHIGVLSEADTAVLQKKAAAASRPKPSQEQSVAVKPPLDDIINLYDFEQVASRTFSKKAWAYINGASNDNLTRDANNRIWKHVWFRPAVMRNVGTVNTKTKLFGCELDLPIYISPFGSAKQAGPEGEIALARAAAAKGVMYCIATPASATHEEILEETPNQAFFQLYVNKDRAKSEEALRAVVSTGKVKAIFITADLPVVSKREDDERVKPDVPIVNVNVGLTAGKKDRKGAGLSRQAGAFIDPTFNWDDLAWVRSVTDLPLVIKGVQRWEDARLAMRHKCAGIVLSNHGGRAADNAPPAIITLLELHKNCPEVFGAMEILIDGGFRRGSDVVKAVCLGASAVGFGRSFLYALNYGREGIEHAIDIIQDEIDVAMRLCGMTHLMRDASPEYLNTTEVEHLARKGSSPYKVRWNKRASRL